MSTGVGAPAPERASTGQGLRPWGHRPALDGLRTISVYLVVAFHADIARFEGGFVGVDLFFVLSGYLVTTVIWTDFKAHDRIRLARFYSRRARRLVPAALLTIVGTALLMLLVSGVISRQGLVGDARASALWYANWHFIGQSSDYFASAIDQSPYLHFWSLSIEEQFYIAFPLTLWGLAWLAKRSGREMIVPAAIGALALISLLLQLALNDNITRAYYGTDTRAYQLLVGALLALLFDRARRNHTQVSASITAAAPVVAIVGAAVFLVAATDIVGWSVSTRGIVAAAASLLMLVGLELSGDSIPTKVLSLHPFTYLGQISYGTYLWHWPVIIAFRTIWPDTSPWLVFGIAAAVATAAAALSSELLEKPIRFGRPKLPSMPVTAVAIAISVLVAVVTPGILRSTTKPPLRVAAASFASDTPDASTPGDAIGDATPAADPSAPTTIDTEPVEPPPADVLQMVAEDRVRDERCRNDALARCNVRRPGSPSFVLIGDSVARIFVPMMGALAEEHDFSLATNTIAGCPWQRGVLANETDGNCLNAQEATYGNLLPNRRANYVIVTNVGRMDPQLLDLPNFRAGIPEYEGLSPEEIIEISTLDSAARILEHADKLIIIEPSPVAPFDPIECLSIVTDARECNFVHNTPLLPQERIYRELAASDPRVEVIDVDAISCPTYPNCEVLDNGTTIYRDPWHVWQGYYLERKDDFWALLQAALQ